MANEWRSRCKYLELSGQLSDVSSQRATETDGERMEVKMQVSGVAKIATTADGKTVLEVAGRPAFELNRVALSIWTSLEAGQSPEEISSQIASEFKAPGELAARDVTRFIKKLKDNLLVYDEN